MTKYYPTFLKAWVVLCAVMCVLSALLGASVEKTLTFFVLVALTVGVGSAMAEMTGLM